MRYLTRHIRQTVLDQIQGYLTDTGWVGGPDSEIPVPFSTKRAEFLATRIPAEESNIPDSLFAPTFSDWYKAPSGLGRLDYDCTFTCRVFVRGMTNALAVSMAEDVADFFCGVVPGYAPAWFMRNYTTNTDTEYLITVAPKVLMTDVEVPNGEDRWTGVIVSMLCQYDPDA